jgi:hypothetical protein
VVARTVAHRDAGLELVEPHDHRGVFLVGQHGWLVHFPSA